MLPRDLADWDPIRDGSYIAALLDRAAENRDLKRLRAADAWPSVGVPRTAWQTRHANLPRAAKSNLRARLVAPYAARR